MRVSAAILLTILVATPAMAIDITSGSGSVVKNGAGLTVINGDRCAGRMSAACLDRQGDRLAGRSDQDVVTPAAEPEPMDEYPEQKDCTGISCAE